MISSDNKRIAKNTLVLYVRMGVVMLVTLFTSRIVLQALGVEDFGIYNIVGGVVVLFSFLNEAMTSATRRFLNFELGKNNIPQVARVFSMSMNVYFFIAGIVLVLGETVGLWFLNTQLNIPEGRMIAANWVYQFSVLSTILGLMLVPYNSIIVAYERMSFYAWVGIVTVLLRLGIAYILIISDVDKLILYAALMAGVGVIIQIVHVVYCRKAFPETAIYRQFRDKKLFKELVSFSGWSLFGGVANMSAGQGVNIVINIFCGVGVNAAVGIANQVSGAVSQLVSNFQVAFNPQIVKRYSSGAQESFIQLIFQTSKFSYFLMFWGALPLILNADFVLKIWLGTVPDYAADFSRWTLVNSLFNALAGPLWMSIQATGRIRNYQLIVSAFVFLNFPVSILLLWLGFHPVYVLAAHAGITCATLLWRVFYLRGGIRLPARRYLIEVLGRVIVISAIASAISLLPFFYIPAGWGNFIATTAVSVFFTAGAIWFFGFNKNERFAIQNLVFKKSRSAN